MTEIEDYILREVNKGFSADKIIAGMEKAGYERDKIEPIAREIYAQHNKRRLLSIKIPAIEHFLSKKIILFGFIPFCIILLVGAVITYPDDIAMILLSTLVFIGGTTVTSYASEKAVERMGIHKPFTIIASILFGIGLLIFLTSTITHLHPAIIGLILLPLVYYLYLKDLNLTAHESFKTTGVTAAAGLISGYLLSAIFAIIIGISHLIA
jgi:hypothetical protein